MGHSAAGSGDLWSGIATGPTLDILVMKMLSHFGGKGIQFQKMFMKK